MAPVVLLDQEPSATQAIQFGLSWTLVPADIVSVVLAAVSLALLSSLDCDANRTRRSWPRGSPCS